MQISILRAFKILGLIIYTYIYDGRAGNRTKFFQDNLGTISLHFS